MTKQPWLVPGVPWKTESAFWVWVRGVLRKGWSKHPVKLEFIKQNRKRIINPKVASRARFPEVWGMTCQQCKQDTVQAEIEIDHVGEQGKFTCLEDIQDYAEHLFMVDFDSLRSVCKPCHKIISYSQAHNLSFEEAAAEKKVIEFMKKPTAEVVAFLKSHGQIASNAVQRRAALTKIFKGE